MSNMIIKPIHDISKCFFFFFNMDPPNRGESLFWSPSMIYISISYHIYNTQLHYLYSNTERERDVFNMEKGVISGTVAIWPYFHTNLRHCGHLTLMPCLLFLLLLCALLLILHLLLLLLFLKMTPKFEPPLVNISLNTKSIDSLFFLDLR